MTIDKRRIGFRLALAVAVVAAASSCATISVHTEYDPMASFERYQTFSWRGGTMPGDDYPELSSDFVEDRVRSAVSRELEALGLDPAEIGSSDLLVDFHLSTREQMDFVTTYHEDGWEESRDFSYTEGALLVDLLDASDESLLWRGISRGVVDNPSPEWVYGRIDEAVTKMFHDHPFAGRVANGGEKTLPVVGALIMGTRF